MVINGPRRFYFRSLDSSKKRPPLYETEFVAKFPSSRILSFEASRHNLDKASVCQKHYTIGVIVKLIYYTGSTRKEISLQDVRRQSLTFHSVQSLPTNSGLGLMVGSHIDETPL
ncbi:MAG: hypothetical protein ACYDHG_07165 [Desulfomonilaceae bacterium]